MEHFARKGFSALCTALLLAGSLALPALAADTQAPAAAVLSAPAKAGDTVTAVLVLEGLSGNANALKAAIRYDSALLQLQQVRALPDGSTAANTGTEGRAALVWHSLEHVFSGGQALELTFLARQDFQQTTLSLSGLQLAQSTGGSPELVTAESQGFSLSLGGLSGDADHSGTADLLDVLAIQQLLLGEELTLDQSVVDLNADGTLDLMDAMLLRQGLLEDSIPQAAPLVTPCTPQG